MTHEDTSAVVITGTSNSGKAISREIATRGGTVAFTYHSDKSEADSVLASLSGEGHSSWQCNVTDPGDVQKTIDEIAGELETIDALFFTAGIISRSPIEETSQDTWQSHMDVNLTGAFNVIKSVTPRLKTQGHGSIVALSASDAIQRDPNLSAYNATKSGLNALVQEAARELAPNGVRVNAVAPGPIRIPEELPEEDRRDLIERTPLSRICTPEDIAATSLFLCSEEAASITGAIVPIDGGIGL